MNRHHIFVKAEFKRIIEYLDKNILHHTNSNDAWVMQYQTRIGISV